ncbi:hypothetical protein, partial [Salinicola aestuarinus]|uniref:hypothetical protein n=1 Tax=Salinicola aestuarinus TaxID=1949082 RepID=UPI00165FE91E
MNAKLASSRNLRAYENPSENGVFFSGEEERLGQFLARENVRSPMNACDTNLFIGAFFDGTGNNYADRLDRED